jgi:hypothetical protein
MNALVEALAKALELRDPNDPMSQKYRASLEHLERVFNSTVKNAMLEAFRDESFARSSGPFREAVLSAVDPTTIRR